MPLPTTTTGAKKRKALGGTETVSGPPGSKKVDVKPHASSLKAPHQEIITALSTTCNILPASIISSTKIHRRVSAINTHLLAPDPEKIAVTILYARPADVHKLITVVELVKRVLQQEGRTWWQYNQLFVQPAEIKGLRKEQADLVEETVLARAEGDAAAESSEGDDDTFEPVRSRLEDAVMPPAPSKVAMSLRVLVSTERLPKMETMQGVTVQTSTEKQ